MIFGQDQEELSLKANRLRDERENRMLSKLELARKAGIGDQTVSKIEKGGLCRLEAKGKSWRLSVFPLVRKKKYFPKAKASQIVKGVDLHHIFFANPPGSACGALI